MPRTPYPISGVVYDTDGTGYNKATVIITNISIGDKIETTTDADGKYIVDRANATKEWANYEVIVIQAFVDGNHYHYAEHREIMLSTELEVDLTFQIANPNQPHNIPIPQIEKYEHDPVNQAKRVTEAKVAKDIRYDPNDDAPVYIGLNYYNSNAATDQKTWTILKFTYSGDNVTRIQQQEAVAWDDRATIF